MEGTNMTNTHQAKKVESGVYDYRGYRLVFYKMPDSSKSYWYIYKQVHGDGDSCFDGYDATNTTTATLSNAKEHVDFWCKEKATI